MIRASPSVFNGCTWVNPRCLHTSVLFGPWKNVPVSCRVEAREFHNLAYSRWIPSGPPWPMSTRLNCLPLAKVIMWLTLQHLCEDDLRRIEMGATKGSVTDSIVSRESKHAASFCDHS